MITPCAHEKPLVPFTQHLIHEMQVAWKQLDLRLHPRIGIDAPDPVTAIIETLLDLEDALEAVRPRAEAETRQLRRSAVQTSSAPNLLEQLNGTKSELAILVNQLLRLQQEVERVPRGSLELFADEARYRSTVSYVQEMLSQAATVMNQLLPTPEPDDRVERRDAALRAIQRKTGVLSRDPRTLRLLRDVAEKVAPTRHPVLILGETGTGKELIARAVHTFSGRKGPFVAISCSQFNDETLESELFGHVRGAFTGAIRDRDGLFVEAHGGTLFLDELGTMPMSMQIKLLRVLTTNRVQPMGGGHTSQREVNVRIVAATNEALELAIHQERFRSDLYYRLAALIQRLPPLRERLGDVEMLAHHFLEQYRDGRTIRFAPEALEALKRHRWPGNIRELEKLIVRLAVMCEGQVISGEAVSAELGWGSTALSGAAPQPPSDDIFTEVERQRLAIHRAHGFRSDEGVEGGSYPGNRQAADRHLRVLMCKALRATDWDVTMAARLLAGGNDRATIEGLRERFIHFLEGLKGRLGGRDPRVPNEERLREAIERQYRADRLHVFRVLDALKEGRMHGTARPN